jgi:hypothetical protein
MAIIFPQSLVEFSGIAAVNIGGCTIHSWAGIGLGKDEAEKYIGRFLWSDKYALVLNRWQGVDTLVIDESKRDPVMLSYLMNSVVSLLDGALFDKLVSTLESCPFFLDRYSRSLLPDGFDSLRSRLEASR